MAGPDEKRPAQAGFGLAEAVVGALLAAVVTLAGLSLVRGAVRLADRVERRSEAAIGARWALELAARDLARAGIGVCPDGLVGCPDEPLELLAEAAVAVRGDRDRDDPVAARDPERWLVGLYRVVPTANDEVVLFLRRNRSGRGKGRATFEADLDGPDRVTLADGREIARRDGVVETIDGGPYALPSERSTGVFYRVRFVNDARRFGSAWFRSMQPLADGIARFEVEGFDAAGAPVPACGGADDADGRACRGRVRRLRLSLVVAETGERIAHEVALPRRGRS